MKKITSKEFSKEIEQLVNSIQEHTSVFIDDSSKKKRKRLDRAERDFLFFAKTYFPHYIRADFGKDHKRIHKQTEISGQITAIAGFRGFGKTTLLGIIKAIWKTVFKASHFVIQIARNEDLAAERTTAIKVEFLFNKRLIHDFGEQIGTNASDKDFILKTGARFLALGYKQSPRGKVHRSRRPDFIIIDDLEDHNSHNERIAKDKFDFVTQEAYGAFEKGQGILIWLGNLTHQKSALNLFKIDCEENKIPMRKMIIIKADDGHFNPTWEENYTKEDLLKMYQAMGRFGYERHMRMNPVLEGLKFKEEWFRYYDKIPSNFEEIVVVDDPSWGSRKSSDFKAIMTLGLYKNQYYLIDCYLRKASITDMIRYLYHLYFRFNGNARFSMEANFAQHILWEYIPKVADEFDGFLLPLHKYQSKINKQLRIESLEPIIENGWILFPSKITPELRLLFDQLLGFPDYPNDDGPDALAEACSQLKRTSHKANYESNSKRLATKYNGLCG